MLSLTHNVMHLRLLCVSLVDFFLLLSHTVFSWYGIVMFCLIMDKDIWTHSRFLIYLLFWRWDLLTFTQADLKFLGSAF